jgi:hypothetical protein
MNAELIKDISLIIIGAVTGAVLSLIPAWLKSIWDRRTTSSNTLFDMRLDAINKIWHSFLKVKTIYDQKIYNGHDNWLRTHKENSRDLLIEYGQIIDENQIILDHCITDEFRNLESYMYSLFDLDDQEPFDYIDKLNQHLSVLSNVINKSMGKRTHTVKLKLQRALFSNSPTRP